jgi:hypothetical protein
MTHDPDALANPPAARAPATDGSRGWLEQMAQRVAERRRARYEEARQAGARWLVECYDRWEFPRGEEGADLFFDTCATESEVDVLVAGFADDPWNVVAGIYDVREPLDGQGGGLSPAAWRARGGRSP